MLTNRKYTEDTADSGYRETVDIVDTNGEWRGYRQAVDTGKQ